MDEAVRPTDRELQARLRPPPSSRGLAQARPAAPLLTRPPPPLPRSHFLLQTNSRARSAILHVLRKRRAPLLSELERLAYPLLGWVMPAAAGEEAPGGGGAAAEAGGKKKGKKAKAAAAAVAAAGVGAGAEAEAPARKKKSKNAAESGAEEEDEEARKARRKEKKKLKASKEEGAKRQRT